MECRQVEIDMPEGYKKGVTVCDDVGFLPPNIKGVTNKRNLILISRYLHDLGIPNPKLYVWIHERNHVRHPEKTEYEIREISDKEYYNRTGIRINTTNDYLFYEKVHKSFNRRSVFD